MNEAVRKAWSRKYPLVPITIRRPLSVPCDNAEIGLHERLAPGEHDNKRPDIPYPVDDRPCLARGEHSCGFALPRVHVAVGAFSADTAGSGSTGREAAHHRICPSPHQPRCRTLPGLHPHPFRFSSTERPVCYDRARSKRSRFITFVQAATKSRRNFSCPSALP